MFVHQNAPETPDGALRRFTVPTPFRPGTLIPVINGRARTVGFTVSGSSVIFDDAPLPGDVVSFFYTQA